MRRMRETDNGSVPAERFGPRVARRLRALLRLQGHAAGQMLLQGGEALLQERLLQVRALLGTYRGRIAEELARIDQSDEGVIPISQRLLARPSKSQRPCCARGWRLYGNGDGRCSMNRDHLAA